jgi:hypothetical protein
MHQANSTLDASDSWSSSTYYQQQIFFFGGVARPCGKKIDKTRQTQH